MNAASLGDDAIQDLARRLAQPDPTTGPGWPELPRGNDLRALAWALKDLCYAALNTEPQRAASAAAALRRLQVSAQAQAPDAPLAQELGALADWTEGAAQVTNGRMNDALASFDRAEAGFRHLNLPGPAAQTRVPRIIALTMLGRHADAADCAEQVKREFLQQGDKLAAGKVSLNLGNLSMQRDSYAPAVQHYRQAAVLFARVRDHQHSVMADIGLANALTCTGDMGEALRIYARASMRAQQHGLAVLQALVDESVALLELTRGRYREALAGLEASRRGYEQLAMPQHLATAEKLLADAYLALRLLPEALALYAQAKQKFEALDMPSELAWTWAQMGQGLALSGDAPAAADALERASGLFAAQGNEVGQAAVWLARAELLTSRAPQPADITDALSLARQAAQAFERHGLAEAQARAHTTQAEALLRGGDTDAARVLFDSTLATSVRLQLATVQVRCLSGRGGLALAHGDETTARAAFGAAVELFEDQQSVLPGDELRSAFLGDHLVPFRQLLRLALLDHDRRPGPSTAQAVLVELDRVRARSLSERLLAAPVVAVEAEADTRALRARLNWLYQRTQRLDAEDGAPQALIAERRQVERDLLEQARRQRLAQAARPADALAGGAPADELPGLTARLGPYDALVEYGVLDDELLACVATPRGVRVLRRLAHWPDVVAALRGLRFQMDGLRHGATPVSQHLPVLTRRSLLRLEQLHALVWAPLSQQLGDVRRVVIVPHAALGTLPFSALRGAADPAATGLGDRLDLAVAASARLALRGLSRPPVPPKSILALGESTRLPHAASEAQRVAALYGAGTAWVGAEASLSTLQAQSAQADVVHLACHGEFRGDNPMFSALHLADAPLTVETTERLRLRPAMVVLSACDTGLAEAGHGDEMFGLVRAFLVAGASRVLASLWPVDDEVTELFMLAFHAALLAGSPPAAALRAAQASVRQSHAHPFFWAAFVLHGGW